VILSTRSRLSTARAIEENLTRFITWLRSRFGFRSKRGFLLLPNELGKEPLVARERLCVITIIAMQFAKQGYKPLLIASSEPSPAMSDTQEVANADRRYPSAHSPGSASIRIWLTRSK
jgi:hypothetical protein